MEGVTHFQNSPFPAQPCVDAGVQSLTNFKGGDYWLRTNWFGRDAFAASLLDFWPGPSILPRTFSFRRTVRRGD
ncbi:MAG: hypothetical protein BWX84_02840 [Verrucomicrobia bacterium ADurb.Bin118]|nr:MAG: hypothetical protein BWX84_02840 [Verrucomicrobia bacterium ADurb.Bin118]